MRYRNILTSIALSAVLLVPSAVVSAQADQHAQMLTTIQQLTERLQALQAQLAGLRGEVRETRTELREEIRQTWREGMRGAEVERLQELLATDPEIYPEGLRTGFFGGMTRAAVARLQERHQLPATGEVDETTRELLNEYFAERTGRTDAPAGILRAPGIRDAVERRVCDRGLGVRPFCPEPAAMKPKDSDTDDTETRPKEDLEGKDEDNAARPVALEVAQTAVRNAERAVDVVSQAVRSAGRGSDVNDARRMLSEADSKLRTAQRALRNREYRQAYNAAIESRRIAGKAFQALPASALRGQRGEQLRDRYERLPAVDTEAEKDREVSAPKEDDVLRSCGLEKFKSLVGQPLSDRADVIDRWEAYHGQRAGNRAVRFLNPGDAMTMDYIETRLNVFLDDAGVVEKVTCG